MVFRTAKREASSGGQRPTYNQQDLFWRNQTDWMQFDDNRSVRGCFTGLMSGHDVDFHGQLDRDDAPVIASFRSEWDKIPRIACGKGQRRKPLP